LSSCRLNGRLRPPKFSENIMRKSTSCRIDAVIEAGERTKNAKMKKYWADVESYLRTGYWRRDEVVGTRRAGRL